MKAKLTLLLLFILVYSKAQMLDESILHNNKILYHKSYINFVSFGYSATNSAIRKNFGSGVGFNVGFAWYMKKNTKLGFGSYNQVALNSIGDGLNRGIFTGVLSGYRLARNTTIEAKFLLGIAKFTPPDSKMLAKLGYEGSIYSKTFVSFRHLIGFNIRHKISRSLYFTSGVDFSKGKVKFLAQKDWSENIPYDGTSGALEVSGRVNFSTIYLGLSAILN